MVNEAEILNAKILIVDDRKDNARSLRDLLKASGYSHVTYTTDGREVRGLHDKNRYNLILLDLQMPGMDGFEVMKSLQPIAQSRRQGFYRQAVRCRGAADTHPKHARSASIT
jgi:CheY-like chemotaxis protein